MKITFVLPGSGHNPVGGFKIIYQYANELVKKGFYVNIVHPALLYKDTPLIERPKKLLRYLQRKLDKSYIPKWLELSPEINLIWVPNLNEKYIPDSDIIVATAWQTAEWVKDYPKSKGIKVYFVQDYEHYMVALKGTKQRIANTFRYFENIIIISPSVEEMIKECRGKYSIVIPNPIDFNEFYLEEDICSKARDNIIGIPVREEIFKGLKDSILALENVRKQFPDIKVWGFGAKKIKDLPEWVKFYYKPSTDLLRRLYNNTSIFVTASHYEGWGLPGMEAMACGCALVSTDHGGVKAYAINNFNALLSPPKDVNALYNNIITLLADKSFRIQLAQNGVEYIKRFSKETSVAKLIEFFCNL